MTNPSVPPLLSPPPIYASSDPSILHTWLNNAYIYLFQVTNNITDLSISVAAAILSFTASIATLNTEVTTLNSEVTTINGAVTTINGEITTIQGNVTTINGEITTIQGKQTVDEGNITTLQGQASKIGLVQLSSAVYSAQTSIPLPTVFTGYTAYKIVLEDMFSSAGSAQIVINFSTNGSTYDSTSGHYVTQTLTVSSTTVTGLSGITTGISLTGTANVGTTIITGLSGEYLVTNPSTTSGYVRVSGQGVMNTSSTVCIVEQVVGAYNQTGTSVKGFQIVSSTGNISGTVKVYGLL